MKKTGVVIAAALALQILLCSCASSDRMIRLSPFGEAWNSPGESDKSRLNIWPLFFQNGSFVSILWPMIDSDEHGFAVRPFFNKEGAGSSVLFPLSSWNTATGQGHVLNIYWNSSDPEGMEYYGFFPLFQHNPGFRQWLIPFYFHQKTDRGETWLTPLFGYGTTDGKLSMFNLLLPVYYFQAEPDRRIVAFCWPLLQHELRDKRERYHLLPFYSNDTHWPALVNWTRNEPIASGYRDNFNILGPFLYQHTVRMYTPPPPILPVGRMPSGRRKIHIAKTGEEDFILFGLFSRGIEHYLVWRHEYEPLLAELAPLLQQYIADGQGETPLAQEEGIAALLCRIPLIPADATMTEAAKILMRDYTAGTESRYHRFAPFYHYRSHRENYQWSSLFGLLASGYQDREQNMRGIRVNPFFSRSTAPGITEFSLLWPLFQYRGKADKKQFSFFWRIFNYERADASSSGHIFFIPWQIK